jgi:NDP-sugar pyrophosphorylase family protein
LAFQSLNPEISKSLNPPVSKSLNLPALVLSAGLGTRLDPLTRLVAKPAVPLAGRTLIERALDWLRAQGVRDVVINLHHRPESITAIVGDGAHLGMRVRYSWERQILGSAGGPRRALPLLGAATMLIINGDTLADVALAPMLEAHERTGADATMTLVPNPRPGHYNSVVLDGEDRVTAFVAKSSPDLAAVTPFHFIGIQIARASLFAPLEDGVPAETVGGVYRDRVATSPGSVRGWRVTVPFVDVGTARDYLHASLALAAGAPDASVIEIGAAVAPSARVVRSVVWPQARVGERAVLHDVVVAGAVAIPEDFEARDVAIVPASIVRAGDRAEIRGDLGLFPL